MTDPIQGRKDWEWFRLEAGPGELSYQCSTQEDFVYLVIEHKENYGPVFATYVSHKEQSKLGRGSGTGFFLTRSAKTKEEAEYAAVKHYVLQKNKSLIVLQNGKDSI